MSEKMIRQVTADIAQALADRNAPFAPTRREGLAFLRCPQWEQGLAALLPIRARLTGKQVLDLCAPLMERLAPAPEEGWLPFCYAYIRDRMFPEGGFAPNKEPYVQGAELFLTTFQVLLDLERRALPFEPLVDYAFLTEEEYKDCDQAKEYRRFLRYFREEFVYELMRLGDEVTPFRTLGHVAGVHHIALTVARGLKEGGEEVDLALISAAAAAHDLGKYGCKPGERVPYLHYYYTGQWLESRGMNAISHIASNHSVWDLELDTLSAESLCLIYADFRSKQDRDENGNEITVLYPLDESFRVILSKLDNVDTAKRRRYEFVYGKLHDFEDYMVSLGVDTHLSGRNDPPAPVKDPSLMTPDETVDNLILLSVQHNLRVMNQVSSERKFGNIIESARSAKNWTQLRAYLNVFGEYCTYLSAQQKTQALAFLYELLVHREGDIRRQAATLIGQIIAKFHLVYRKEVPVGANSDPAEEVPFTLWEQYLNQIIYPDHKTTAQQRNHIGYSLKLVVGAMLEYGRPETMERFMGALLAHYEDPANMDSDTAFTLLDAIRYLPPKYYNEEQRGRLIQFSSFFVNHQELRLRMAVLLFYREVQRSMEPGHPQVRRIVELAREEHPGDVLTVLFLRYQILKQAGRDTSLYEQVLYHQDVTGEVFLENLKNATPWVNKVVGIELLRDQVEHGLMDHVLHISTHFSNLIKVSERVVVRHTAGQALVGIMPHLSREQRNEVVVELGKGLEMGQYQISKYIPEYLGQAALHLYPSELDELVMWLKSLLGSPSDSAVAGALNTIGVLIQRYPQYRERFPESKEKYEHRRQLLMGFFLQGLASYREAVRQEALLVTGKMFFQSDLLSMEEKSQLFSLTYRKLLFLIREEPRQDSLTFFYRASALAHINRFIAMHRMDHGPFTFENPKKIAFFPGTFDPFTLSHKGIVHAIRDMGFEVYLAVDEFSWSKKAQPHLVRRQIVNLSIAGAFHVHLFPDDIPVNIANPSDLKRLRELFPGQELYLVVGADVVANASSYRNPPVPWSVHSLNHIIFIRADQATLPPVEELSITGEVVALNLPPHLEDISSTRIRENVDANRDISNFIDPVIQDFIYQNGLYMREAQNKPILSADEVDFQWVDAPDAQLLTQLTRGRKELEGLKAPILREKESLLLLRRTGGGEPLGFASWRTLNTSQLFTLLGDVELADRVRLRAAGKVLVLSALVTDGRDRHRDFEQLLLTEVLARALEDGCVYALYDPHGGSCPDSLREILERQGFQNLESSQTLWEVDMHAPTVLIQNLETTIQEPLAHNPRVLSAVRRGHRRVQRAVADLYPGSLVLTLSADVIHHRLLERITTLNNVPSTPTVPRVLGKSMCVPYGKMLRGKSVPNTVTKTIHTDRVYEADLRSSTIEAFPYYAPIPSQIRVIKSFDRPVILVDDLMHPGVRLKALDPYLHHENIPIQTVLVGVLSGHGKDLMDQWERPVESVYFLPTLRQWFVESTLYPFIGGNTVRRPGSPVPGLLPGINHILPYAAPAFQGECSRESIFNLSRTCLECSRDVISVLEQEYRSLHGRNLTLGRLPEAVVLPLCPDKGECLHYDPNLAPSVYLDNDLEQLLRQYQP